MIRRISHSETAMVSTCEASPLDVVRARVAEARRLRSTGLSFAKIGQALNIATMTAFKWCQPDYEPRYTPRTLPFDQRLVSRLVVPKLGPCLEWQGVPDRKGYGSITINGRKIKAHRYAYERAHGPIPQGLLVCHRCDNPPCCEPTHIYAGTHADNSRDAARAGTLARGSGEASLFCRYSDATIAQARQLRAQGQLLREIAAQLGIEASYVSRICRGEVRP